MPAKEPRGVEPYNLDSKFENALAYLVCSRSRVYGRIGHAIEPDALGGAAARLAITAAQNIALYTGRGPDSTIVVAQRIRRMISEGKVTVEQANEVLDMFDAVEDAGVPPEDDVVSEIAPILQRRVQQRAIIKATEEYAAHGDFQAVVKMLTDAAAIGRNDITVGVRLGAETHVALQRARQLQRLSTGVPELDYDLDGGLERGSLGMFVAGAGGGKSMALSHLCADAMRSGLLCAYATLELPEDVVHARLLANLTGVPTSAITSGNDAHALAELARIFPSLGGCYIKAFTPQATTVADMTGWTQQIEDDAGRALDLLVVDYADKMTAALPKGDRDSGTYRAMMLVYEGLRVHAHERGLWCWTASQAARGSSRDRGKRKLDIDDVSDSINKARVVDLMISLNEQEAEDGEGRSITFFVAKNRTGKSRFSVGPLPARFDIGRIAPCAPASPDDLLG